MIGPNHSIIRRFTSTGHGAAAWTTTSQRAHVVRRADVVGQLEHPHEHRRHHLRVGDPVALDRPQRGLGVELLHHHQRAAERVDHAAEAQRRRVVDRRRREVDGVLVEAVERAEDRRVDVAGLVDRDRRQRRLDPLRPPGGAGGVEQVVAVRLLGQRLGARRRPGRPRSRRRRSARSRTSTSRCARPGSAFAGETSSAFAPQSRTM